jgi:hypothetical protein
MIIIAEKLGLNQLENGECITDMSVILTWRRAQRVQFAIMLIELKESAKRGSKVKTISFSISSPTECTEKNVHFCNGVSGSVPPACKQQIGSDQKRLLYL